MKLSPYKYDLFSLQYPIVNIFHGIYYYECSIYADF